MLTLFRNPGESIRIYNELTEQECIVTLMSHSYPTCELRINGEMQIKKIPETLELDINDCSITILSVDRGAKFGLVAPNHIRFNRV